MNPDKKQSQIKEKSGSDNIPLEKRRKQRQLNESAGDKTDSNPDISPGMKNQVTEALVQDELPENEQRLRQITDNSPGVFYIHDRATNRFIYISPAYENVWGRTRQELYDNPSSFLEAIHPEDLPSVQEAIRMELEEGKYFDQEYRIIQPSGGIRWVHSRNFPVLNDKRMVYRVTGIAEDITERKEAEDALKESEDQFRKIFENSPVGMALVTPDFRFFSVNQTWIAMTGYSHDELLKMSFKDITHPDHLASDIDHIRELAAGTIPVYITEKRYVRKDGSTIWGLLMVTAIRNQQGSLRHFAAQIEDITERRKAEKALMKLSSYNRNLIEVSLDPLITISHEGKIQDVNLATEVVTGCSRSELVGTDFSDYFVDPVKALEGYQEVFRKGMVRDFPLEIQHRDGHITPVLYNASLYCDDKGKTEGVFAAARDITELKKIQTELQESEQKYRDLAEMMPLTIFETDLTGRFTYANRFALNFFGYETGDLKEGLDISRMVVPGDVIRAKQNLDGIVHGKKSGNEYQFLLKNGDIFTGIAYLSVIEKEGHPVGLRGIIVDITERKQKEDVFRLSHALLDYANRVPDLPGLLEEYTHIIQDYSGCDAVGIRFIDEHGNIPYQAYTGFSSEYPGESPPTINSDEWVYSQVIKGSTDLNQPFFTQGGSFYMNGTTKFLAAFPDEANRITSGVCNKAGYESIAVIPIRQGNKTIGLIHLADHRENMVPLTTVQVIEETANPMGSAVQRIAAEKEVRDSLEEKEVLLREIHHRVKNNLARIISLIGLQKAQLSDPKEIAQFRDLESRIRSMSLVHEALYHSRSFSRINAQTYVEDLVQHLIQAYAPRRDIRWNIQMGTVILPIDTAIHSGLILTEIITNSLKYAFPEGWSCEKERGEPCEISISMKEKDGFIILNASDNGRGLPPGGLIPGTRSLGLTLIRILAKNQLHGDLEMITTRGTSFTLQFVQEPTTEKGFYAG